MSNTATKPNPSASPFVTMQPVERAVLNPADRALLVANEAIIERGNNTFVEVGRALLTIRDHENGVLYKERYGTFENYWRDRWGFEHAHVYRLMDAAKIYDEISPGGELSAAPRVVTSERQMRALKRLPTPELRRKAWGEATQSANQHPISTKDVESAVRQIVKAEGIKPAKAEAKSPPLFCRVALTDIAKIRELVARLREQMAKIPAGEDAALLLDKIEELLPMLSTSEEGVPAGTENAAEAQEQEEAAA